MAFPPRSDHETITARQARHAERADNRGAVRLGRASIEPPVRVEQSGQDPQHRNQTEKDAFQNLHLMMAARPIIEREHHSERREKQRARENPNAVDLKRRINLTGGNKNNGAQQEPTRAVYQTPAKQYLGRRDSQAAFRTLCGRALRAAFHAMREPRGHERSKDSTNASNRSMPFDSATSKLTPIPCPGATRRTTHCSKSGGCTPSRASKRAPTQSGWSI